MSDLVVMDQITKVYKKDLMEPKTVAVNNLTLKIVENDFTGLVGYNGAGKSTCIKVLMNLIAYQSGRVLFNGKPIQKKDYREIGYIPERLEVLRHGKVRKMLELQLSIMNVNPKMHKPYLEEAVEQFELQEVLNKDVKELSKGYTRRLQWALAAVHQPSFFVFDEPFSGLDPLSFEKALRWIRGQNQKKKTFLFCSHYVDQLLNFADRIYILKKGELLNEIVVGETIGNPHPLIFFSVEVWGFSAEEAAAFCQAHQLQDPSWEERHGKNVKLFFDTYDDANAWLKALTHEGIYISSFEKHLRFSRGDTAK